MKDSIGILAPGKGWGNFVSYISCFKTISENRNKKVILITKKFSSAKSYLYDQNFVEKFIEIPDNTRGIINKIKSVIYIYKELKKLNLNEIFIFHSSPLYVIISYLAKINPSLEFTSGNSITFDVSDQSLLDMKLDFFDDINFKEIRTHYYNAVNQFNDE